MRLLDKLLDAFASGEVVAVVLAGGLGWGWGRISAILEKGKEKERELGRYRFKEETQKATKAAIQEELGHLNDIFLPALQEIRADIQELKKWLQSVDDAAGEARQVAKTIEATQTQWLKRAESHISAILSANGNPVIVRRLFEENQDDEITP